LPREGIIIVELQPNWIRTLSVWNSSALSSILLLMTCISAVSGLTVFNTGAPEAKRFH